MTEPRDITRAADHLAVIARRRQLDIERLADPRDPRRAWWTTAQRSTDMGSSGPEQMRESARRHRRGAALCYDGTPQHHWHDDVDATTGHVVRCCWCRRRETLAELSSYKPVDLGEALMVMRLSVQALIRQFRDQVLR